MNNKGFVLVEVIEREISVPKFFVSFEEAHDRMKQYYKEAAGAGNEDAEDFDPDDLDGELNEWDAYCENRNHDNCDWKIFQLDPFVSEISTGATQRKAILMYAGYKADGSYRPIDCLTWDEAGAPASAQSIPLAQHCDIFAPKLMKQVADIAHRNWNLEAIKEMWIGVMPGTKEVTVSLVADQKRPANYSLSGDDAKRVIELLNLWQTEIASKENTPVSLDLRDMVSDEVEYKKLDPAITDKAVQFIRQNNRLMEMLDMGVGEAIRRCCGDDKE